MIPFLECSRDETHRCSPHSLATVCPDDGAPLLVRYAGAALRREAPAARPCTMWRYREMLPIGDDEEPVSMGEGAAPLIPLSNGPSSKTKRRIPPTPSSRAACRWRLP